MVCLDGAGNERASCNLSTENIRPLRRLVVLPSLPAVFPDQMALWVWEAIVTPFAVSLSYLAYADPAVIKPYLSAGKPVSVPLQNKAKLTIAVQARQK